MLSSVRRHWVTALIATLAVVIALAGDERDLALRAVYAGDLGTAAPATAPSLSARIEVPREEPATSASPTAVPSPSEAASPSVAPTPDPTVTPPSPVPTPAAVVVAATPRPTPIPTPAAPTTCPSDWFCYPRLGIQGAIVPYTDCTGGTDVGTQIRAYTCLSSRYLMGHAYTQMGKITGWQAGDVVFAYGQAFTVTGAVTERSCEPPHLPLATLSMQTSLSPDACGPVLVVQAR